MGIKIPEGYSNVSLLFTCDGSPKEKVTSFGVLSLDLSTPTAVEIADIVYPLCIASGRPFATTGMLNNWAFLGVSVSQTVDGFPVIGQHLSTVLGTAGGQTPPSNVALLVKKVTGSGGRHNRGRMYVPPCGVASTGLDASGNYLSGGQGAQQLKWTQLYTALIAAELVPQLFHSDDTPPTPVTGFSVESQMATQRRRMR